MNRSEALRTALLTLFTMIAFAANSILCRMALGAAAIDPVSFTTIRIVSGAVVLVFLARMVARNAPSLARTGWKSPAALFIYAIAFSFAYLSLDAGVGALILFGAVQVTMIGAGLARGERPHPGQWIGLALAVGGLLYLMFPGATAPPVGGALLMAAAGVAWGVYSLRGGGAVNPIALTAFNFGRASAFTLATSVFALRLLDITPRGAILAVLSGAVTSGLGYALWYRALRGHTATSAAIVQLSVPIIAALGGGALLDEVFTLRLGIASAITLGGVLLAILSRRA